MTLTGDIPQKRRFPKLYEQFLNGAGELTEYHGDYVGLAELQNPAPRDRYDMRRMESDLALTMHDLELEPVIGYAGIVVMPHDADTGLPSMVLVANKSRGNVALGQMISGNANSGYAKSGEATPYARDEALAGLSEEQFRVVSVVMTDLDKGLDEIERANPGDRLSEILRASAGIHAMPRMRRQAKLSAGAIATLRQ